MIHLITMSGTRGYFDNGIWVEERESATESREEAETEKVTLESATEGREEAEKEGRIENAIDDTTMSVKKAIDNIIGLGKKMVTTEEGRAHIEKKARDAGDELQKVINEVTEKAKKVVK